MSHRKFEAPRHGHLGFLPRKRTKNTRGKMRSFPKDDASKPAHLTAFMGYKAGMTHVVRYIERPGSVYHKKESVEGATILETPPMSAIGIVGYVETPAGLRSLTTVWSSKISTVAKRRFYKNWYRAKRKAFTQYVQKYADASVKAREVDAELERMARYCSVIRVIMHTNITLIRMRQKTAHVFEVQVNGGATVEDKIRFAQGLFEADTPVDSVFDEGEYVDAISVTKGHGFEGVITRWGVKRLPRKTHRGLRKIACIGAWHPARVGYYIGRAGQRGYHHRTEKNKRILRIGKKVEEGAVDTTGSTDADLTQKGITPISGFPHYGIIRNDWLLIKGSIAGGRRRPITLRKTSVAPVSKPEPINLKFIDTASQMGHGRFQTRAEKAAFFGPLKKDKVASE